MITQIYVLFECRYRDSSYMNYHDNDSVGRKNSQHGDEESDSDISFDSSSFSIIIVL